MATRIAFRNGAYALHIHLLRLRNCPLLEPLCTLAVSSTSPGSLKAAF